MSDTAEPRQPLIPRRRIAIHDYGGYPFTLQLAEELAGRGHDVAYLVATGFRTPKASWTDAPQRQRHLSVRAVELPESIQPNGPRRIGQERRYAARLAQAVTDVRPDVLLSANTPVGVQDRACRAIHDVNGAFVFWMQDLYSIAVTNLLSRRSKVLGTAIGAPFRLLERRVLRSADAVVPISEAFVPLLHGWAVGSSKISVIPNWAPLEPVQAGDSWAAERSLPSPILLYAGTLGLKHDPGLLLTLARELPTVSIVVVAEGPGAAWLREEGDAIPNLHILPFQSPEQVPGMLAAADVLLAILQGDASTFSAPSKVLTYLAAGRPILAAMPIENPAAQAIERAGAGVIVPPQASQDLIGAARALLADAAWRRAAGEAGRAYAESQFDILAIGDRFEDVIEGALQRRGR